MKRIKKLKNWAGQLKMQISVLYLAYRHTDTPIYLKIFGALIVGYAFSPIDLIPDFIPILGYVDDLIILPACISLFIKLIPKNIWDECKLKAENEKITKTNWIFALFVVLIWISVILLIMRILYNKEWCSEFIK